MINCYDFDGVISIGINPSSKNDVIITGRTFEESEYVNSILKSRGITNAVYFNPIKFKDRGNHTEKSRVCSGNHKVNILRMLQYNGVKINAFFEDDVIQADIIKNSIDINLVFIDSNLVKK